MATEFTSGKAHETLKEAARALMYDFTWNKTREGHEYWEKIHARIQELSEEAKKKNDCEEQIADLKRRIAELEQRC